MVKASSVGCRETPPRAWGRPSRLRAAAHNPRNTPTGVGKTMLLVWELPDPEKHPHGRGEDASPIGSAKPNSETPPRAWGRPSRDARGTRSTRKHPHGRGEDKGESVGICTARETPPRAWGRPLSPTVGSFFTRNTPTGVGKTRARSGRSSRWRKHPHGRGEDAWCRVPGRGKPETPPRAWGRQRHVAELDRRLRNTPTGVGKT